MKMAMCALVAFACMATAATGAPKDAITIMASGIGEPAMAEAADLADTLSDGADLRIIPMVGEGPVQTLADLLRLDGVDAAIFPSDTLAYATRHGLIADAATRVSSVAKTGGADVHVLALARFAALGDLAGKRVNIGSVGEGRFVSASLVFDLLGITIKPVEGSLAESLALLQSGAIDAVVIADRKPSRLLSALGKKDGLRLLPIPMNGELAKAYAPQIFADTDYPGLIGKGEAVETVSASSVLAALNWKPGSAKYARLEKLATALFANAAGLQAGRRRAAWHDVNLAAAIPGWARHRAAEAGIGAPPVDGEAEFRAFLAVDGPGVDGAADEKALFARFEEWKKKQGKETTP
jgi:uncharacterized protein